MFMTSVEALLFVRPIFPKTSDSSTDPNVSVARAISLAF
jgi:hypothetical protein